MTVFEEVATLQGRMDEYIWRRRKDTPGMTVAPEAWSSIGFNLRPVFDALPALLRLVRADAAVRESEDAFTDAYTSREAKAHATLLDERNDALDALIRPPGVLSGGPE